MRFAALGLALVGVIGLFAVQHRGHAEDEVAQTMAQEVTSRDFTLSADPSVKVLQIVYRPAMQRRETHLSLFADGRFLAETTDRQGTVLKEASRTLSFEETRSIVEIAVSHGLIEATAKDVVRKVNDSLPPGTRGFIPPDDAGRVIIAVNLDGYIRNGEPLGPTTARISLEAPKIMHRMAPTVPEPAGFVALSDRLLPMGRALLRGEEP